MKPTASHCTNGHAMTPDGEQAVVFEDVETVPYVDFVLESSADVADCASCVARHKTGHDRSVSSDLGSFLRENLGALLRKAT